MKEKNETIWLRIGVTLIAPESTIQKIREGDDQALLSVLSGNTGQLFADGETYLPTEVAENKVRQDIDFLIHPQKIQIDPIPKQKKPSIKQYLQSMRSKQPTEKSSAKQWEHGR